MSRAADERGAETRLSETLLVATRSDDFDALVRWTAAAGPPEIASLASHVLATAASGDAVAAAIVHYAAEELAHLAAALRRKLGAGEMKVALTGGLFADAGLRQALSERLRKQEMTVMEAPVDAVAGALRLADKAAQGRT